MALSTTQARSFPWRRVGLLAVAALAAVLAYFYWSRRPIAEIDIGDDPVEDPRLAYTGPFRNVHPDVKYVGDQACTGCHKEICQSFHQHAMGRSVVPIESLAGKQHYDPVHHNPFTAVGREFRVEHQGGQVVHEEIFRDVQGREVVTTRVPVQYVIGSGSDAYSYLFVRDGRVFQSPITWFSQKQRWDLSPGYDGREDQFTRTATPECLFCHTNRVEHVPGTVNRYREPLFPLGQAIGCERCHGPGELHVRERKGNQDVNGRVDHSIVNPAHLELPLREAVCQQCHLEGDRRVTRRGRDPFDFRPGLPLYPFYSVFIPRPEFEGNGHFVGHFEQMHASRCYSQSKGKLDCVTCHDPHTPTSAIPPGWYRNTCVNCHQDKRCSLPLLERQKSQDNCITCHMPREQTAEVRHTATTNHAIPKRPVKKALTPRPFKPGEIPLVYFFADQVSDKDPDVQRDLGLALWEVVQYPVPARQQLAALAVPYLEASLRRAPNDAPAREALAFLHNLLGRPQAALEQVELVLARSSRRETALAAAAEYAETLGDSDKALLYARKVCEVNPYIVTWRERLAQVLLARKDFDACIAECRAVLSFNPGTARIRALLAAALVRSGQIAAGEAEFETAIKLNPYNKKELRIWFDRQRPPR